MKSRGPSKKARRRGALRVHGELPADRSGAWDAVFALARRIPKGRVMTYGQIATAIGSRLSARAVGWAMHGCPKDVPWQRVVNAAGGFSTDRLPDFPMGIQQTLLEAEGVLFRENGTVDLERCRWTPRGIAPDRPRRQSRA